MCTVAELIKHLQTLPQDAEVQVLEESGNINDAYFDGYNDGRKTCAREILVMLADGEEQIK